MVVPVASFKPKDIPDTDLVTWDHYLAWAAADSHSADADRVVVYDLDTKSTKIVARRISRQGELSWVRGSKGTLTYVELASVPSDENPDVPWAVYSVDLSSGQRRRLAASLNTKDEILPPYPEISWPWVVWSEIPPPPAPKGSIETAAYDLRAGAKRVVVPMTQNPAFPRIDPDTNLVVYGAPPDPAQSGSPWTSDVFATPIDHFAPRRLTTSGKISLLQAANGSITWEEPPSGTPTSLWVEHLDSPDQPYAFASQGDNPFPGKGFVIWRSPESELFARDPYGTASPTLLEKQVYVGTRWWVWGDRVVWATIADPMSDITTVHVVRVVKG